MNLNQTHTEKAAVWKELGSEINKLNTEMICRSVERKFANISRGVRVSRQFCAHQMPCFLLVRDAPNLIFVQQL